MPSNEVTLNNAWTLRCLAAAALLTNACDSNGGGPIADALCGQITVKDVSAVSVDGDGNYLPPLAGPGTGAIVQKVTPEVIDLTEYISDACGMMEDPDYPSQVGLSPITLKTSTQDLTATYDADRYRIDGLIPESAYDTDDESLEIGYDGDEPFTVSVPAPPAITDPNVALGMRNGLATEVRANDGEFDVVVVSVSASDGTSQFEIECTYDAASMSMDNGVRSTPLLDADARAELESRNIVAVTVIVSIDNQVMSDQFFPGAPAIAVRAGRAMSIDAASLTVPEPGACNFPAAVPLDGDGLGKLCFNQGPQLQSCTITSGPCPDLDTYFEFSSSADTRIVRAGTGLQVATSSHGTVDQVGNRVTNVPDETEVTVGAADFNANTFTVSFRFSGQMVSVSNLTVE
jgi:hypothetical protein